MKRLTKEQREDVAWWRKLARDHERETPRTNNWGYCIGICNQVDGSAPEDICRREDQQDMLRPAVLDDAPFWWDERDFGVRATACCLIAAMIEAGDLP